MDETMLLSRAPRQWPESRMPLLDREVSYKTVLEQQTLDAHAEAEYQLRSKPTVQWSMTIRDGKPVKIEELRLGARANIHSKGDPWIEDKMHEHRIIEYSGDIASNCEVEFQPIGA